MTFEPLTKSAHGEGEPGDKAIWHSPFFSQFHVATLYLFHYADAARWFFQSKCEEAALNDKGRYERKVTLQRRRNRLLRVSTIHACVLVCLNVIARIMLSIFGKQE